MFPQKPRQDELLRGYEAALLQQSPCSDDTMVANAVDLQAGNAALEKFLEMNASRAKEAQSSPAASSSSVRPTQRPEMETSKQKHSLPKPVWPTGGNPYVEQAKSSLGKDLLPDRARTLKACAKSAPSRSKRKQFEDKWGFKKARGGKCRQYFAEVYHRDA